MYKSILVVLALSFSAMLFGQKQTGTEQLYAIYFKTWNFLKYYHPDLASGKRDADSLFLKHLPELSKLKDQKAINKFFKTIVTDLSVPKSEPAPINKDEDILDNNDFNWRKSPYFFDKETQQKLETIFENRYKGNDHYYLPEQSFNAELPHEKEYTFGKDEIIPLEYRLLALAKIQGAVDYLYPHKYRMKPNVFDELLLTSVNTMIHKEDRLTYELTLLRLTACLEDSHTFNFHKQMHAKRQIFNTSVYPPFDYQVFDDGILVKQIIVPEACLAADLKDGDYITAINGTPLKTRIDELSQLLSTSNRATLIYHLSNYAANLVWGSRDKEVSLEVLSQNDKQLKKISFIGGGDPGIKLLNEYLGSMQSKRVEDESLIVLNNEIAYFRIDNVFRLIENVADERIDHQMDSILNLAKKQKGIIFDMRGYPDWGGFALTYVVKSFTKTLVPYAKYYQVNKQKIGTYVLKTAMDAYYNPALVPAGETYTGKVAIIVNPATQSMSEWNTMCLQQLFPNAATIGEQSAGADGDLKTLNLPGGYAFDFTGNAIFYPDGTEAQKKGVKITVPIKLNRDNFTIDNDYLLERAIEFIVK